MGDTLRYVLRVLLCLWGLLMVGVGMAQIVVPDVLRSENPPSSRLPGLMQGIAVVGYGLLLSMPPRALAGRLWLCALLVASVVVLEVTILQDDHAGYDLRSVAVRLVPVAVALALVTRSRRVLAQATRQPPAAEWSPRQEDPIHDRLGDSD